MVRAQKYMDGENEDHFAFDFLDTVLSFIAFIQTIIRFLKILSLITIRLLQ